MINQICIHCLRAWFFVAQHLLSCADASPLANEHKISDHHNVVLAVWQQFVILENVKHFTEISNALVQANLSLALTCCKDSDNFLEFDSTETQISEFLLDW